MELWRRELVADMSRVRMLREYEELAHIRYDIIKTLFRIHVREFHKRLIESLILRKMVRWYFRSSIKKDLLGVNDVE